jgi:hypothetical protein
MKTYRLQYRDKDQWRDYTAHDKTPIEFLSFTHAQSVAADLMGLKCFPIDYQKWQICDSTGQYHPIAEGSLWTKLYERA